jgi:hypothetical protein
MEQDHGSNTTYYIYVMITELVTNLTGMENFPNKKWDRVHLDNGRFHTSQESVDYIDEHKFVRLPHPPYSLDLAPSDFNLFGTLKGRLVKGHGTAKEDLFQNTSENLESTSEEELIPVFLHWTTKLKQVIATGAEYIEIPKVYIWSRYHPPSTSWII